MISRIREIIAYLTGFGISVFGWKKILHMQFRTPLSFADRPASQLDGETLTWFYFGHSYVFACVVGFLQIAGALLLFFRRTRQAGAILLSPVMLNILLINIFYQMNSGALLQSILLTLGLVYILGSYASLLLKALFPMQEQGNNDRRFHRKWTWAIITAGLSFLFVWSLSQRLLIQSPIYGRYMVKKLSLNGITLQPGSGDSILTKVYFDLDNVCILEYNDQQRRLIANYSFIDKPVNTTIESRFNDGKKSLPFHSRVIILGREELFLKGILAKDSIAMVLQKME